MATENQLTVNRPLKYFRILNRIRKVVQLFAFLLFLYLLLIMQKRQTSLLSHDLFLRLDPLIGITAMIASQSWMPSMIGGGSIVLVTFFLGRVWCSWICPLGTFLDWTHTKYPRKNNLKVHSGWLQVKFVLLTIILITAIFGSLTLLFLDPITLVFRTMLSAVLPAFNVSMITMLKVFFNIKPIELIAESLDKLVRGLILTEQPFFPFGIVLFAVFAGILGLNGISSRFWCRYLCPLGALLALISSVSQIRHRVVKDKCTSCQRCARICPTGAIDIENNFVASSAECIACLDCIDCCPTGAISFDNRLRSDNYLRHDIQRRQLLTSLSAVAIGAALLYIAPGSNKRQSSMIRPPGAVKVGLMNKCIRCGECAGVCPTGVIQPSYSLIEFESLMTPVLQTRLAFCDYSCTLCGQVCPTGAITKLSLEEKQNTVIGIAGIDKNRCIPYAEDRDCIVCEEMCPVPQKAVKLDEKITIRPNGEITSRLLPRVIQDLCIGCGICEYKCPVNGESAIRVYPNNSLVNQSTAQA